jgi:oxygen-independent coproporphyrinogen-3 oxidase
VLGLYLHIPFCGSICSYCNFNRGLFDADLKARYVAALEREIRQAGDRGPVDTIFLGGGTPSLLEPGEVAALVTACSQAFTLSRDVEITLEANPETVTVERLRAFRAAGINRISFGVQSFDDGELRRLGRAHTAARAAEAVTDARRGGFPNVSLDLMCWLPGQSAASWQRTLETAVGLAPDHLSLYLLELYPNAPLKEAMARATRAGSDPSGVEAWRQRTEDEAADMYLDGLDRLDREGFAQYEISNVARPGFASRHNLKYWTAGSWRGFGCGAHSTVEGERWHNIASTADYVERIASGRPVGMGRQRLTHNEQVAEALFTGLRLNAGIDVDQFAARYGCDPREAYGEELASCVDNGLMWSSARQFGLTRRGMLVSNEILATFV